MKKGNSGSKQCLITIEITDSIFRINDTNTLFYTVKWERMSLVKLMIEFFVMRLYELVRKRIAKSKSTFR